MSLTLAAWKLADAEIHGYDKILQSPSASREVLDYAAAMKFPLVETRKRIGDRLARCHDDVRNRFRDEEPVLND